MYCSGCGEKLENGTKFCPKCGRKVETAETTNSIEAGIRNVQPNFKPSMQEYHEKKENFGMPQVGEKRFAVVLIKKIVYAIDIVISLNVTFLGYNKYLDFASSTITAYYYRKEMLCYGAVAAIFFVSALIELFILLQLMRAYLCIAEDRIYGRTIVRQYEYYFHEITEVTKKGANIKVKANGKWTTIYGIENMDTAYQMIVEKIGRR